MIYDLDVPMGCRNGIWIWKKELWVWVWDRNLCDNRKDLGFRAMVLWGVFLTFVGWYADDTHWHLLLHFGHSFGILLLRSAIVSPLFVLGGSVSFTVNRNRCS